MIEKVLSQWPLIILILITQWVFIPSHGQLSPGSTSSFRCPSQYGYFPNPVDCASYYYCSMGNSYLQYCPEGLYFWARNKTCTTPEIAQCRLDGTTTISVPWQTDYPYPGGGIDYFQTTRQPLWTTTSNSEEDSSTPCNNKCCRLRVPLFRSICLAKKSLFRYSMNTVNVLRSVFRSITQQSNR